MDVHGPDHADVPNKDIFQPHFRLKAAKALCFWPWTANTRDALPLSVKEKYSQLTAKTITHRQQSTSSNRGRATPIQPQKFYVCLQTLFSTTHLSLFSSFSAALPFLEFCIRRSLCVYHTLGQMASDATALSIRGREEYHCVVRNCSTMFNSNTSGRGSSLRMISLQSSASYTMPLLLTNTATLLFLPQPSPTRVHLHGWGIMADHRDYKNSRKMVSTLLSAGVEVLLGSS